MNYFHGVRFKKYKSRAHLTSEEKKSVCPISPACSLDMVFFCLFSRLPQKGTIYEWCPWQNILTCLSKSTPLLVPRWKSCFSKMVSLVLAPRGNITSERDQFPCEAAAARTKRELVGPDLRARAHLLRQPFLCKWFFVGDQWLWYLWTFWNNLGSTLRPTWYPGMISLILITLVTHTKVLSKIKSLTLENLFPVEKTQQRIYPRKRADASPRLESVLSRDELETRSCPTQSAIGCFDQGPGTAASSSILIFVLLC